MNNLMSPTQLITTPTCRLPDKQLLQRLSSLFLVEKSSITTRSTLEQRFRSKYLTAQTSTT